MITAAHEMLRVARQNGADLAILMDISAACGSQVIYKGSRSRSRLYQASQGVCAALLIKAGIPVVSQRDFKTLHAVKRKLVPRLPPGDGLRDHHEGDWYRDYFVLAGG